MNDIPMTYADSGVNIDNGNLSVEKMKPYVKSTFRPEVITDLGGFGGLFALQKDKYEEPILVSGTDGVGTKLDLAFKTGIHETIGIDAVAMCVNDILVSGAEPIFFLDYLAVGQLDPEKVALIVKGIADGCKQAGCALIGGETAEMPGFYKKDEYDVAGFSVGIVDKKKIVDGSNVKVGDKIIGLASTGLHSNGFSLARKVLFERAGYDIDTVIDDNGNTVGQTLLTPTRIYVPYVMKILEKYAGDINAMAHITGGGLIENIPRVLPENTNVNITKDSWEVPHIFTLIQNLGNIESTEMYRTFNMGIGYVLVVKPEKALQIQKEFSELGLDAYEIGEIVNGSAKVEFV